MALFIRKGSLMRLLVEFVYQHAVSLGCPSHICTIEIGEPQAFQGSL